MDRREITDEMRRAQADFHALVDRAAHDGLRRRTNGTRWTTKQLLWHMAFGYLIVRTLMPLVHVLGRLGWSRRLAAIPIAVRFVAGELPALQSRRPNRFCPCAA
jgi:hypothetical protein